MDNRNELNWRAPLIPLAATYKNYLPVQYACLCTKFFHKWFDTEMRKDELRKLVALDTLIDRLEEGKLDIQEIHSLIKQDIGPFKDTFGKNFFDACEKILLPHFPHCTPQSAQCSICFDALVTHILMPCGHAPCCETCLKKIDPKSCPICRQEFSDEVPLKEIQAYKTCSGCLKAEPNILFLECKHVLFCEECRRDLCPICNKKGPSIKVFLHDNGDI